jgi:hypothetical protein
MLGDISAVNGIRTYDPSTGAEQGISFYVTIFRKHELCNEQNPREELVLRLCKSTILTHSFVTWKILLYFCVSLTPAELGNQKLSCA